MKKLLTFLFVLAFACPCFAEKSMQLAWWNVGVAGSGAVSAPACATLSEDTATADTNFNDVSSGSGQVYIGSTYAGSSSFLICKIVVRMVEFAGNIDAKTYYAAIYSTSGTSIVTELGLSDPISGATIGASYQDVEFVFSTPITLDNGKAIVIYTLEDAVNYAKIASRSDVSADWKTQIWNVSKGEWGAATYDIEVKIYE